MIEGVTVRPANEPRCDDAWDEIHVGTRGMFAAGGMTEVHQPGVRRVVMRIDFRT